MAQPERANRAWACDCHAIPCAQLGAMSGRHVCKGNCDSASSPVDTFSLLLPLADADSAAASSLPSLPYSLILSTIRFRFFRMKTNLPFQCKFSDPNLSFGSTNSSSNYRFLVILLSDELSLSLSLYLYGTLIPLFLISFFLFPTPTGIPIRQRKDQICSSLW